MRGSARSAETAPGDYGQTLLGRQSQVRSISSVIAVLSKNAETPSTSAHQHRAQARAIRRSSAFALCRCLLLFVGRKGQEKGNLSLPASSERRTRLPCGNIHALFETGVT